MLDELEPFSLGVVIVGRECFHVFSENLHGGVIIFDKDHHFSTTAVGFQAYCTCSGKKVENPRIRHLAGKNIK